MTMCFLLVFMALMIAGKGLLFLLGDVCNKAVLKENLLTAAMLTKIFWFGVLSDFLALLIVAVCSDFTDGFSFATVTGIVVNVCMFALMPYYGSDLLLSSLVTVLIIMALSAVISLIFNYLTVFRKSTMKKNQKVKSMLVFFIITAPYYLLISLSPLVEMFF